MPQNTFPIVTHEIFLVQHILQQLEQDSAYRIRDKDALSETVKYYLGLATIVRGSLEHPLFYHKNPPHHHDELDKGMRPYKKINNWERLLSLMQKLMKSVVNDSANQSYLRGLSEFNYGLDDSRIKRDTYETPILLLSLFVVGRRDPLKQDVREGMYRSNRDQELLHDVGIGLDFIRGFEGFLNNEGYIENMGCQREFASGILSRNARR